LLGSNRAAPAFIINDEYIRAIGHAGWRAVPFRPLGQLRHSGWDS
jgi:hypothetical protein